MSKSSKPKIKIKEIKSKIKIIEKENSSEEATLESEVQESDSTFGKISSSGSRRFSPSPLQAVVGEQLEQQQEVSEFSAQNKEEEKKIAAQSFSYGPANRGGAQAQNAFEAEEKRMRGYESQSARQIISQPLDTNLLRRSQAQQVSQEEGQAMASSGQRIQTGEPSMLRAQEDETKKYDFDSSQSATQKKRRMMF